MTTDEKRYLLAKEAYYSGTPIMSDAEFDGLEDYLKEQNSSVVQIVGSGLKNERVKFKHLTPMLSLGKISADASNVPPSEEFKKWWIKVGKPGFVEYTPKYDGNAISLQYKGGNLFRALTRGDGEVGQDVTNKLQKLVPNSIHLLGDVEVRGEMLMPLKTFTEKYEHFKNPRNLVAGILSSKTVDWDMVNDMHFVPYEVKVIADSKFIYNDSILDFFKLEGFLHLPDVEIYGIEAGDVEAMFKSVFDAKLKNRDWYQYQLDGMVFKLLHSKERLKLGDNGHHPNFAIAVKFAPKLVTTTINDIEWFMGKTGNFTPVAILEPVDLDGSMVSKCSLHNYSYILRENVYPGAIISLKKAGDIIPQVEMVIHPAEEGSYEFPAICEHCGATLKFTDVHMLCPNKNCSGLASKKFVKNVALLEMDFFGGKTLEKIFDAGIGSIIELLDPNQFNEQTMIASSEFKKGKTLDRLLYQVKQVKEIPLWKLIVFLGIDNLGETVSKQIAKMISGQDYSMFGLEKKFFDMFGIGQYDRATLDYEIESLTNLGIKITGEEVKEEAVDTSKKTYVVEMTGSPKPFFKTKDEFISEANNYANVIAGKLDAKTNYLVTDDTSSKTSKMDKAAKLGVAVITYDDFISMIK